MKKTTCLLIALMACMSASWAQSFQTLSDKDLIDKELKTNLADVLHHAGYDTQYAIKDSSLNIFEGDVNYWFKVRRVNKNLIGLTLNRKGFSLAGENPLNPEAATLACNEVNIRHFAIKMYCDKENASVRMVHQTIVKSCADLKPEVLKANVNAMRDALETFKAAYKTFNEGRETSLTDTVFIKDDILPPSDLVMQDYKIYNVDANGKELSKAEAPNFEIMKSNVQFINPVIDVLYAEKGKKSFNINVKIYREPANKKEKRRIILYKGYDYSLQKTVDITGGKKPQSIDLGKIGDVRGEMWVAGSYTVEITEGDRLVGFATFKIK